MNLFQGKHKKQNEKIAIENINFFIPYTSISGLEYKNV